MSATRKLACYLADLEFDRLPGAVQERAKLAVLDMLGICVGGWALRDYSGKFLRLAREVGGGAGGATLFGDGHKVSLPLAAFGNTALATTLDYGDSTSNTTKSGRWTAWLGPLAVPAAIAAVEVNGGSGKDLLTAVVAGYECAGRIVRSMDVSMEQERNVRGQTASTFAAAGAAARGLGLRGEAMLSALGMAGIQTTVPANGKFFGDVGLRPRKDVKQGWAWMGLSGAFAAQAAQLGFRMTQENNILDGDYGLWRMLGMDSFDEGELLRDLDSPPQTLIVSSKPIPGCGYTWTALTAALSLVRENKLDLADVDRIDVATNRTYALEFDDQAPETAQDQQFSTAYQVAAALSGLPRGPQWYGSATAGALAEKVHVTYDAECERNAEQQLSKVRIQMRDGQSFATRMDMGQIDWCQSRADIEAKFQEVVSGVITPDQASAIARAVDKLDRADNVRDLLSALTFTKTHATAADSAYRMRW